MYYKLIILIISHTSDSERFNNFKKVYKNYMHTNENINLGTQIYVND